MKLRVPAWRVIKTYLILGLIVLVVFYGTVGIAWPPTPAHYFVMVVWFVSTLVFLILSLTQSYYVLQGKDIVHHRLNKEITYVGNNILYVNESWSLKNKTLLFYDTTGNARYLPFDKEARIYEHVLSKANNLMTKEEFQARFPTVKL